MSHAEVVALLSTGMRGQAVVCSNIAQRERKLGRYSSMAFVDTRIHVADRVCIRRAGVGLFVIFIPPKHNFARIKDIPIQVTRGCVTVAWRILT